MWWQVMAPGFLWCKVLGQCQGLADLLQMPITAQVDIALPDGMGVMLTQVCLE
jgi:hypothetical protein